MKQKILVLSVAAALLPLSVPAISWAQAAPGAKVADNGGLAEVIVTAERRAKSVQKSALSISVLGGDALTEKGITNTKDLLTQVPGLSMATTTPNANLSLRGVGSNSGNSYSDPAIAFNIDGVTVSRGFSMTSAMYDLQRVEVLKGPQGTLYGRNATVGAINLIANRPVYKKEALVAIDVGNYKQFGLEGMLNLPVSDTVAVRGAFKSNKHDGYLSNGLNDADNYAARLSVLTKPSSDLTVLYSVDYFHDGAKGQGTVFLYPNNTNDRWANASNPWQAESSSVLFGSSSNVTAGISAPVKLLSVIPDDAHVNNSQTILKSELTWNLGWSTFTFLPAYVDTSADFKAVGQGFYQIVRNKIGQTSLEARLASNGDGPWNWLVGGYYYNESQDSTGSYLERDGFQVIRNPNLDDTNYAIFGQTTYAFMPTLRVTGGLRYTTETKTQDGYLLATGAAAVAQCTPAAIAAGASLVAPSGDYTLPNGGCKIPNGGTKDFDDVSYKLGLEYDLGPQSLLYADVSTAFKSGGFWPGLSPNTYKPEKLTAYVLGSKNRFLDNKLQFNAELFYWDYKDQQLNVRTNIIPTGTTTRPINTNGWIKGAEFDVNYRITPNDRLRVNLLLSKGQYKVYPGSVDLNTGAILTSLNNWDRVNLPTTSGTISYEHTFDLDTGATITAGINTHFETDTWLNVTHPTPAYRGAYHQSNLNLTYLSADGAWQVTGYVNNVEDVAVPMVGTSLSIGPGLLYSPRAGSLAAGINAPRTYGIRASMKF